METGPFGSPSYAWLYSPNGNCIVKLGLINNSNPAFLNCVMALLDRKILICGIYSTPNCYMYNVLNSTIDLLGETALGVNRGVLHQGKIYLPTYLIPPILIDPVTMTVSTWATAPSHTQFSCFVSWNNYILKFGALLDNAARQVWRYDPQSDSWSNLTSTAPFVVKDSGCLTLPNGNILILGCSSDASCFNAYTEYNVQSNTWSPLRTGIVSFAYSLPMLLGKRVLVLVPSKSQYILEYFYQNSTMSTVPFIQSSFTLSNGYAPCASVVPIPWFSNLPSSCKGVN